ncbi:response regulator receiver [Oleiphilus messinensis]|uniref:Response regulator receiver n=1 Tax=Oleiphilus messinensis TaxID=141451 RepID=A0A1Y0I454_9GAMM|nr:response regulator [Oleiphilus messinensis]ARU54173.1 response regulator receiver [Oleiphilus messinensis]
MQEVSVLIVEDDPEMRSLLRKTLSQIGVSRIGEAEDGNNAIQKYLEEFYDIVMLDIGLPDMDGLKLLSSFKRLKKDAFVVLVTGDDSIESIQTAISSGANGYVVKPYSYEKILDVINNYMLIQEPDQGLV